jgi:hypothetical protein
MLTENQMAKDVHDLLLRHGLKTSRYRIDVCSGINLLFPPGAHMHGLPFYAPIEDTEWVKHRDLGWCDLVVVDTADERVELMVEFETNTNPKDLAGNFFYPFMAFEYKSTSDNELYTLDVSRTVHALLACLEEKRGPSPNQQTPVQKGIQVARWLSAAGAMLAGNVLISEIKSAFALAGDDWTQIMSEFESRIAVLSPHLFQP